MSDKLNVAHLEWSADEQAMLARIARLIIGADPDGIKPAVDDDKILADILARATDFERPIRKGFDILEAQQVCAATDETLTAMLSAHRQLRSLQRAMMQIVAQCYYRDERVLRALGFAARPPFPIGHELEEGDWSLLDPVKGGRRRYRNV